jgi:hypothetical protein
MKHGNGNSTSSRRSRNRNNRRGGGNQNRTRVYDSNGPDVRVRGTAHQVAEKYLALAKDSASAGDHVMAESYYQFAEHYQRILSNWDAEIEAYENAAAGKANADYDDDSYEAASVQKPQQKATKGQQQAIQTDTRELADA